MTSDIIRFAVMGYGHIGRQHAGFISANPHCCLTGICDTRDRSMLGLESSSIPFFRDEDELLQQDFDVLCITTPNGLHEKQALKALERGYHVLIEKPLALSRASCERILELADKRGRKVFCVMQNRYAAPSVWFKNLLEQDLLGKIYLVSVNCFWNRDGRYYQEGGWRGTRELDGGTLFTQFSHFIDSLIWFFGDIKDIDARFANFSHKDSIAFEDTGMINFNFCRGGMGSLHYTTSVSQQNLESSLTVIAEKGTIKISGQYMDEVTVCRIDNYTMPGLSGTATKPVVDKGLIKPANHTYVFENIVNVLCSGASPDIDPSEAMKVVETIEKIYACK